MPVLCFSRQAWRQEFRLMSRAGRGKPRRVQTLFDTLELPSPAWQVVDQGLDVKASV